MELRKVNTTSTKDDFEYDKGPSGTTGYLYYKDGVRVSRTFDPTDLTVTFGKPYTDLAVEAVTFTVLDKAKYPPTPTPPPPPSGTTPDGFFKLGDSRSIAESWYTKLPTNPEIDSNSDSWVGHMSGRGLTLNDDYYGIPVFDAGPSMVKVHMTGPMYGAPSGKTVLDVPIPDNAYPAGGDDGHMAVIDRNRGCMYELYQATKSSSGTWSADGAMAQGFPSIGYYPEHNSCRGSGLVLLLGLIRPDELQAGVINHAICIMFEQGNTYIPSRANQGDGSAGRLPNGARFFLPSSVDVNSLTSDPYKRIVARAVQQYGAVLVDGSPNAGLQHVVEYRGLKMTQFLNTMHGNYPDFSFLISHLKLEKISGAVPRASAGPIQNACTIWS